MRTEGKLGPIDPVRSTLIWAAERRALVRLERGAIATLWSVSPYGSKAKVKLASGAFLSVPVATIQLVPGQTLAEVQ